MDIKNFLDTVCQEIKYEPARNAIAEELKSHIEDIKEDYINDGMKEQEAEEKAVFQMGIAEEIGIKLNKIHRPKLDWKLLILIIALMGFGLFVSIIRQQAMNNSYIGSTIIYMAIGIALSIGIYFFDYKRLKKYSSIIYLIASTIMILSMLNFGFTMSGLHYIHLFGITIFPPTVAVPLYLIAFIGFVIDYNKDNNFNIVLLNNKISINKDIIKIIACSLISLFLMATIPSIINVVILGIAYLIISTIKIIENKKIYIRNLVLLYCILFVLGGLVFITLIQGSSFRLERIVTSFNPERAPQSSGYVGMLQKEILEHAKLIGEVDTYAISSKQSIINTESNYTFIYILGKTGFLVAGLLIVIIILTSIKLIFNARNVKERYGKFLIIGLSTLYILQSFATILMNINMGIQTNVNLPIVTYGGVYFLVNILSIALILSIYRRKDINEYDKNKKSKFVLLIMKENN